MSSTSSIAPSWDPFERPMAPVRRFTVDQYHRLIADGYFGPDERFELLEGWIVPKMTRNPPHDVAIMLIDEALRACLPGGWSLRIQSAITTADSEPEPDLAIVRGVARDYLRRHPGPDDLALVIEVADTSLPVDRTLKLRLYARAGIACVWIVDLVHRSVEVHTGPTPKATYASRTAYREQDDVPVVVDGQDVGRIGVATILP